MSTRVTVNNGSKNIVFQFKQQASVLVPLIEALNKAFQGSALTVGTAGASTATDADVSDVANTDTATATTESATVQAPIPAWQLRGRTSIDDPKTQERLASYKAGADRRKRANGVISSWTMLAIVALFAVLLVIFIAFAGGSANVNLSDRQFFTPSLPRMQPIGTALSGK